MEERYHRIVVDGETYYREYCERIDRYGNELLTEEELIETLLWEVVEDEITVDHHRVENALRRMMDQTDQNLIRNYILFLERQLSD